MAVDSQYAELHCHSFYSFGEGASQVHELVSRAVELGYPAMALTDYNMCGALEFSRQAKSLNLHSIIGSEIILEDESHIVLLAENRSGYSNITRLLSIANSSDRKNPRLHKKHLRDYSEGVIALVGPGRISKLVLGGNYYDAVNDVAKYIEWFGLKSVYIELNRNYIHGDLDKCRHLNRLANEVGLPVVATNNVFYHAHVRHKLQDVLVAIKHNKTIENSVNYLKANGEFYLKSSRTMSNLFHDLPSAISNTITISERCDFDLSSDLGYELPEPYVPEGYSSLTYLRKLCFEAANRRYSSLDKKIVDRIEEEMRLIDKHGLSGFMLLYREIALLARSIMVDLGKANVEDPLEWRPSGRGRGSSVAMLTGYLIGISHVDPLKCDLTLERFIPEDMRVLPDIDLDFPRYLRGKLITRIHDHFGPEFAVLSGMIGTYKIKGIIKDVGKVFGLPDDELKTLSKQIHVQDAAYLKNEMLQLPKFKERVSSPGWKHMIDMAIELEGAPKTLGQHVGGMILSSSPIPDMVPIRESAIPGRYIMDWDKDSVSDARFAKIDILSLPVLDQLEEAIFLIEKHTGSKIDLSRIDLEDSSVFDMINQGLSRGVFLIQSPAQLKMAQRLKSRNLLDLAYQVALIRPGVGVQESGVSQFVDRYRNNVHWDYDHPLEHRALERGYGVIVWQEQVVQLISDVSGMSQADADEMRRAFSRRNNSNLIKAYKEEFIKGALRNGVEEEVAIKIFSKINGHYMFPESHSHAFAISAYQAAWIKCYFPLEFYISLMNNQPMGFYPNEAIKQDARRFGIKFGNPCINKSILDCSAHADTLLIGLRFVKNIGNSGSNKILKERLNGGEFYSLEDFVERVDVSSDAIKSLVESGAFDIFESNRRLSLWKLGLYKNKSIESQLHLNLSMDAEVPDLEDFSNFEAMLAEYNSLGIYPKGHIMEFIRGQLNSDVSKISDVHSQNDGDSVVIAGWAIARQHPRGHSGIVFITIEDETSDVQLIIWPKVFNEFKSVIRNPLMLVKGEISRWDSSTSIEVNTIEEISVDTDLPPTHDWY